MSFETTDGDDRLRSLGMKTYKTEAGEVTGSIRMERKSESEPYALFLEQDDGTEMPIAFVDSNTDVAMKVFDKLSDRLLPRDGQNLPTEAEIKAMRDEIAGRE